MSDYKHLLGQALRSCPNIYSEPLDVVVAMMGDTSGFKWNDSGELESNFPQAQVPMDFSDIDERTHARQEDMETSSESMRAYYASIRLEDEAARMRRQFIDQNMETIVNGSPVATYFRDEYHLSSTARKLVRGENHSYENCNFLYFPDNIAPQWGDIVRQFQDWVEMRMNHEFGVSASGLNSHWPEQAQLLKHKLRASRARLHPLLHDGEDYDDHLQKMQELSQKLIGELMAEEQHGAAVAPTRSRRMGS